MLHLVVMLMVMTMLLLLLLLLQLKIISLHEMRLLLLRLALLVVMLGRCNGSCRRHGLVLARAARRGAQVHHDRIVCNELVMMMMMMKMIRRHGCDHLARFYRRMQIARQGPLVCLYLSKLEIGEPSQ